MARKSEWSVTEPRTLHFDDPIEDLEIRTVSGTVNVVGTDSPATRVEIAELSGPPLVVSVRGRRLTVAYEDLPWHGFLKRLERKGWRRSAVVTVSVPASVRLSVGVVRASAVLSRIAGPTDLRGVSGDATLVGLSGRVRADTVSGAVETQAVTGKLSFNSVSGRLTMLDHAGESVGVNTVSGDVVLDLAEPAARPTLRLTTVSGDVALRLPAQADAKVSGATTSGPVSSAFPELSVSGTWGAKSVGGTLGAGTGSILCHTVSGAFSLLRRPRTEPDATAATTSAKDV
ncbi:DUF4097 family beta strand repeat-containing protein [Streptomyces hoynatensis]|uniref:DUF4097 domain-containing protein n=1 Tax=Streptomyces hoynatensis TaxID=1141874 RepID=A0A3A9YX55_9ACTN|nr:DUF4097 family beta strand repeat-containing protein [Streptomyces hoynatensis]RKN40460.1 hypothetical protein D7294_18650 [Streptomyces hoynatensis]